MSTKKLPMTFDSELGRWVAEGKDEWYSLRCGEPISIHIGQWKLDGRLEFGKTWYIIVDNVPFGLIEGRKYTVTIQL